MVPRGSIENNELMLDYKITTTDSTEDPTNNHLINIGFKREEPKPTENVLNTQYLICGEYLCIAEPELSQTIKVIRLLDLLTHKKSGRGVDLNSR